MTENIEIVTVSPSREIGVITSEIKTLCRQSQVMVLTFAVEIGKRLKEAKESLPHGEWGDWLKNEVEFSQSSANNFMKLYEEYGSTQFSFLMTDANSQMFANLPYSMIIN